MLSSFLFHRLVALLKSGFDLGHLIVQLTQEPDADDQDHDEDDGDDAVHGTNHEDGAVRLDDGGSILNRDIAAEVQ